MKAWLGRAARRPVLDLVLLAAVLLAQGALIGLDDGTFTSDDGVYALQAEALVDGRWTVADRFLEDGPDGALAALANVEVADGRVYPYVKHPAWPAVLAGGHLVAGEAGLYAITFLAGLAVPLVAWWCASCFDRRWRRAAFWAAAASPAVVANSHALWAHSVSALLAGVAVGAAARWLAGGRRWWLAAVAGSAFAAVLLRREDLLLAAAAGAALAGAGLARRQRRPLVAAGAWVGGAGAGVVADAVASHLAVGGRSLATSSPVFDAGAVGWFAGRLDAAQIDLLTRSNELPTVGLALVVLAVVAVFLSAWAALRERHELLAVSFAAVAALAAAGTWVADPASTLTGLLAAWPIAGFGAAGLVALGRSHRWLAVAAGLFAVAVIATDYAVGGGLQWGGRFLSPLTVPLAVGAASLWRARPPAPPHRARLHTTVVVVLVAVAFGHATTMLRSVRDGAAELEAALGGASVVVTEHRFAPNILWRAYDDVDWLMVGDAYGRSYDDALELLAAGSVERFHAYAASTEALEAAGAEVVATDGPLVELRLANGRSP